MIDGCTRFGAFMRVVLPLSLPGLTSAFVLNAILGWSQFIIPFILHQQAGAAADLGRHLQFPGHLQPDLDADPGRGERALDRSRGRRLSRPAAPDHRRPHRRRGERMSARHFRQKRRSRHARSHDRQRPYRSRSGCGPWQAGADEALATMASAADRCDEYPEFIFTRGEAWLYQVVERVRPDLFARIRQADRARPVAHHRRPVHPARPEPADRRRAASPDSPTDSAISATASASRRPSPTTSTASATPPACPTSSSSTAMTATSSAGPSSIRWRCPPTLSSGKG